MKRPDKIKFNLVKPPSGLIFQEALRGTGSVYVTKLQEALSGDSAIEILASDKYLAHQLKSAAKKIRLKLVFATQGDRLYIKPIVPSEDEKRLLLLLREPRTMNELREKKFEIDLGAVVAKLRADGIAHVVRDKWVLTDKGAELIGTP